MGARRHGWSLVAAAALIAAGFVIEWHQPSLAGGALYTVAVLLGLWTPRSTDVFGIAGAATLAAIADRVPLVTAGDVGWLHLLERTALLVIVWGVAFLVRSYRRDVAATIRETTRAQAYLDVSGAILVALDREGRVEMLNATGCEVLGVRQEEVVGTAWIDTFIPEEKREEVWGVFRGVLAGDSAYTGAEGELVTRGGRRRIVHWRNARMVDPASGEVTGTLSSGLDITEQRDAEAQLRMIQEALTQASEELRDKETLARIGEMAAVVAHEVRNPLAGIRGALQILGERFPAGSPEEDVVREMVRRIDGLDCIVTDLLEYARPRAPLRVPLDLASVVSRAARVVGADPRFRRVDLEVRLEKCSAIGDAGQLEQAFLNVLVNAAQAAEGGGTVRVALRCLDGRAELTIEDEGPGIPEGLTERVFDPFVSSRTRGSGLGLPIARRILDAHGGTVRLSPRPGRGTLAVLELPSPASDATTAGASQDAPVAPRVPART